MGTIPHVRACAFHTVIDCCSCMFLFSRKTEDPCLYVEAHVTFWKASNVPGMPPTLFSMVLLLSGSGKRERRGALIDWFGKANNKDGFLSTLIWPFQSHFESHSTLAALFQDTNRLVKYRESPFPFISRALAIIPFVLRQRDKYTNPITQ